MDDEVVDDDAELVEAITAVNAAEGALIEAQEQRDKARSALVGLLLDREQTSVVAPNSLGERYRVSVVASNTVKVDEEALRERIGARSFNKLTRRKLDLTKVSAAVAEGALDAAVLAEVSEVKARATYPRVVRVG